MKFISFSVIHSKSCILRMVNEALMCVSVSTTFDDINMNKIKKNGKKANRSKTFFLLDPSFIYETDSLTLSMITAK